jgi:hypothetical protein
VLRRFGDVVIGAQCASQSHLVLWIAAALEQRLALPHHSRRLSIVGTCGAIGLSFKKRDVRASAHDYSQQHRDDQRPR